MNENIIFAKRIGELRRAANMTQAQLAKNLNISRSCLANYESCRRYPNLGILQSVAEYFNVNVSYLIGNEDPDSLKEIARRREFEFANLLSNNSKLDLSDVSPAGKIALIEFYQFLSQKSGINKKKKNNL